jgi:hypothetical protein
MVGLQPNRQSARKPNRIAKASDYSALASNKDQVLIAHQLTHRCDHFRREARRQAAQPIARRLIAQKPIAKFTNCHVRYALESRLVVTINDQPRHLVHFVGNDRFIEEERQGHVSESHLGGNALLLAFGSDAGEHITAASRRSLRQQYLEILKDVRRLADGGAKLCHVNVACQVYAATRRVALCATAVRESLQTQSVQPRIFERRPSNPICS